MKKYHFPSHLYYSGKSCYSVSSRPRDEANDQTQQTYSRQISRRRNPEFFSFKIGRRKMLTLRRVSQRRRRILLPSGYRRRQQHRGETWSNQDQRSISRLNKMNPHDDGGMCKLEFVYQSH